MKKLVCLGLATIALALMSTNAGAYDFGFVRAPDWMDVYVAGLIALQAPFWLATYLAKPAHVPFNQVYRAKVGPWARTFHTITLVLFSATMVLVFAGMGLARL
jgi:hypothetical protein